MPGKRFATGLLVAISLVAATSCALRPAWQTLANEGGLEPQWLQGTRFRHLVLANGIRGNKLHIYIEGDGSPWIYETRVTVDPTPTNPVLLRLMLGAAHPAVYLGRPCYFGAASDTGCEPALWTYDRYGRQVVDSMCEATNKLVRRYAAESVELIGYSGGGAIAVGMTDCTERLGSLVTIAGNLDPDAWTRYHDYSPLGDTSPLAKANNTSYSALEAHWQCRNDANIPPSITDAYFARRPDAIRHIVDDCAHAKGWEAYRSRIFDDR